MNLKWTDGLSVNNKRIDCEHQMYFDLIIALYTANSQNANKEKVVRLLKEVELFTRFHFMTEENLMLDSNYSEYNAHAAIHSNFLNNIKFKIADYANDSDSLITILDYLCEWFLMHISNADKKFGAYLLASSSPTGI